MTSAKKPKSHGKRKAEEAARPLRAGTGPSMADAAGRAGPHSSGVKQRAVIQIEVRAELKRALKRCAEDAGWTALQGYLLSILMEAGLPVLPEDLVDRRQGPKRPPGAEPARRAAPRNRSSSGPRQRTAGLRHSALDQLLDMGALGLGPNCIVIVNTGENPSHGPVQPVKRPKRRKEIKRNSQDKRR